MNKRKGKFINGILVASFLVLPVFIAAHAAPGDKQANYPAGWIFPGQKTDLAQQSDYRNSHGKGRVIFDQVAADTANNPFFLPLGSNGRACVSCHQPMNSMSLSVETIQQVWEASQGHDPIFAPYDGSNCPTLVPSDKASHSLLLEKGLFRVQMPWPPKPRYGKTITPDFSIEVVRDPNGCNSTAQYGPNAPEPSISVYRRPRPVANMKYLTAVGFAFDPKQGGALPLDPETNQLLSGNLMADNRALTLKGQMQDAAATHLQMLHGLNAQQVTDVEQLILNIYAAQIESQQGGMLNDGAQGGPEFLRDSAPGQLGSIGRAVWSEFTNWENISPANKTTLGKDKVAFRESIARGARVFREKMFLINDTTGINSPIGFGNPVLNSCVFCHNMSQMGNDVAPGQVDIGTNVKPYANPEPQLPLFKITCAEEPHPHYGAEFYTQDPGFGLVTGKCADVGKITLQSMRGLSARAPYFSNGSAKDLGAVIDFYNRRYNIGYTEQEKQDLINLMSAL